MEHQRLYSLALKAIGIGASLIIALLGISVADIGFQWTPVLVPVAFTSAVAGIVLWRLSQRKLSDMESLVE